MTNIHRTINRSLATVALVLSIVVLSAIIYVGVTALQAASQLGDALGNLSDSETVEPYEPIEQNDGGADYFEQPTPVAPDPSDPYAADNEGYDDPYGADGYIGNTNPDGTPCVGYGCTPEMDAEILEGEAEANN